MGCYGYPQDTSPNIDNLAENGVLFENAFSCSNATDPSLTTIFSGKYPTNHGIINHGFKVTKEELQQLNKNQIMLLPEMLKSYGYTTLAVDWLGRWHRRGYDFYSGLTRRNRFIDFNKRLIKLSREFKRGQFHFNSIRKLFDEAPWGIRRIEEAEYVGNKAIDLVKENSKNKFFLFLHFWDTHAYHFNRTLAKEKWKKRESGEESRGQKLTERYLDIEAIGKEGIEILSGDEISRALILDKTGIVKHGRKEG